MSGGPLHCELHVNNNAMNWADGTAGLAGDWIPDCLGAQLLHIFPGQRHQLSHVLQRKESCSISSTSHRMSFQSWLPKLTDTNSFKFSTSGKRLRTARVFLQYVAWSQTGLIACSCRRTQFTWIYCLSMRLISKYLPSFSLTVSTYGSTSSDGMLLKKSMSDCRFDGGVWLSLSDFEEDAMIWLHPGSLLLTGPAFWHAKKRLLLPRACIPIVRTTCGFCLMSMLPILVEPSILPYS